MFTGICDNSKGPPLILVAVLLVITAALIPSAASIKCAHCVCKEDCEKHKDQMRTCPTTHTACVTIKGPGAQMARMCSNYGGPDFDKEVSGANGAKNTYCKNDLCNCELPDCMGLGPQTNKPESSTTTQDTQDFDDGGANPRHSGYQFWLIGLTSTVAILTAILNNRAI